MISISIALSIALVGADPVPAPDQKELEALSGEWVAQQFERQGQKTEVKDAKFILEFKGDKWIFTGKEKGEIIALDPKTDPKCMDVRSTEEGRKGQVDEAIYKVEGDVLTICLYQGKGKQRPASFETSPEQVDTILIVLQRVKKK